MRIDAPATNSRTRQSIEISLGARHLVGEQRRRRPRRPHAASSRPSAPPAAARTSASISSCWKTRPRPAPSAARIAISLRRPSARVNSRLPTLAQAISSTSADRAEQHDQRRADVADDHVLQRHDRRAPAGVGLRVVALEPLWQISVELRRAPAARPTPGLSRADDRAVVVLANGALARPYSASGTQRSRSVTPHAFTAKRAGMTPTIV